MLYKRKGIQFSFKILIPLNIILLLFLFCRTRIMLEKAFRLEIFCLTVLPTHDFILEKLKAINKPPYCTSCVLLNLINHQITFF